MSSNNYTALKPDDIGVEKSREWYRQYAEYVASKYNPLMPRFYPTQNFDPLSRPERWASRVMRLFAYVFAEQENSKFDYMAMDEQNNPLPTKLINTHVIHTLVAHMMGSMQDNISSLPDTIFARAMDSEWHEMRQNVHNLARFKMAMASQFKELEQEGLSFEPTGGINFSDEAQLEEWLETTMQHDMEKYFTAWAKDWLYKTDYMSWAKLLFRYLIPAYFNRIELYTEEGNIKIRVHKPQYCIWDNSEDDEFGRKQKYQGVIEEFTIPGLKHAYPELTEKQLKELQDTAKDYASAASQYTANTAIGYSDGIMWYGYNQNLPVVAVVKARWVSVGDDGLPTWFQCDLIGNKFAVRCKPCDNLVKDSMGYLNPPFIDFIPELISGLNKSPVDRALDLADKIKGYEAKIDLIMNRIKGNVVTLFADRFPEGADQTTILQDIANGLLTLEGVDIDDLSESEKRDFLFQVQNIGVDFNSYNSLRNEVELAKNEIREIFSIPRIAMGQQTRVIGKGVQEQSITQATFGVTPLYDGFAQYLNNIVHAACEIRKNLLSLEKTSKKRREILQITPQRYETFKITKDWALTDMNIYLDRKDAITEEERRYLMTLFERELQVPESFVDSEVVAEAMNCKTNTQLRNLLKTKKKQHEKKMQEQMMQQQQMQAAQQAYMQEMKNEGAENVTKQQGDNALVQEAMRQEGAIDMGGMGM